MSNSLIRFVSSHLLAWTISVHSARQRLTPGSPLLGAHNYATPHTLLHLRLYELRFLSTSVVPHSRTLCPASPSLQWVLCASVPHLHGTDAVCCLATGVYTYHRYYDPLRLPIAHLGVLHFRLPPIPCKLPLRFVSRLSRRVGLAGSVSRPSPGLWFSVSTPHPLTFTTRKQLALPSSQVIPVSTCPVLRPRWCPAHSPYRIQDCCLPLTARRRLSLAHASLSTDHDYTNFEAQ